LSYIIQINKFHGPFDLLFYLIETNEVNIYDIPIAEITEQYIAYLDVLQEFDMAVASEFVLMAATLIEIKSKLLLPSKEKKEDPREELVNQLLAYKLYKQGAEALQISENKESLFIGKPAEDIQIEETVSEQLSFESISAYDLLYALKGLLKKHPFEPQDDLIRIEKEEYSINDCILLISEKLQLLQRINLIDIITIHNTKSFVITVFLSILEMSRLTNIQLVQDKLFGDIYIQKA